MSLKPQKHIPPGVQHCALHWSKSSTHSSSLLFCPLELFQMSRRKFLVSLVFLLASLCVNLVEPRIVSKDTDPPPSVACTDCSLCPYPCHNLPPPGSQQGYPAYGAPPPPPPTSPMTGYGAPPPPPPLMVQGGCPPGQVAACCQFPPPAPYGYRYAPPSLGYGPPGLGYGPPGLYEPYGGSSCPTIAFPWLQFSITVFLISVCLW